MRAQTRFPISFVCALGAAVGALTSFSALAHDAVAPAKSRAEVRAETREAAASGQLAPAGEREALPAAPFKSMKTRAEREAETRVARENKELRPAGEHDPSLDGINTSSDKTRAQRKSETLAARHAGKLLSAGDAAEQR